MKGIVLNSTLLYIDGKAEEETSTFLNVRAAEQKEWLLEELENAKLCCHASVVFTYHPWHSSFTPLTSTTGMDCLSEKVSFVYANREREGVLY